MTKLEEFAKKFVNFISSNKFNNKELNEWVLKLIKENPQGDIETTVLNNIRNFSSQDFQNGIDAIIEETNGENSINNADEIIAGLVETQKNIENQTPLGELSRDALKNLSASELTDKLTNELENIQFDVALERQEFFKYISGFDSFNYTFRNRMILKAQANARGYFPVFASLKEWNKQNTSVKRGENGLLLCIPSKLNLYFSEDENGQSKLLPFSWDAEEIKEREKLVEEGKLGKTTRTIFNYKPTIFSISQTNMKEQDKVKYIQQYNAHNTSEQNLEVLNKELELCEKLGIDVQITDTNDASLGFVNFAFKTIVVQHDMPVDAKISTLTHELGHYLFHRHPEIREQITKNNQINPYALGHKDREVQAQLFSHIVLEGLGVDSESDFSLRYINSYLFTSEKGNPLKLSEVKKSSLLAHLSIVHKEAVKVSNLLKQESISDLEIKQLLDFMPDRYLFDSVKQRAEVILNETILAQEAEIKDKAQKAVKNQNKSRTQKGKMVQSM